MERHGATWPDRQRSGVIASSTNPGGLGELGGFKVTGRTSERAGNAAASA